MNHEDPAIRTAVADGSSTPIPATNVAGCCQAFRRDLLAELGYLMDEFSPYGYEDAEFCIRALRAGRRNYVDPSTFMLHGTDGRHLERRTADRAVSTQRNLMRCKTLLAWRHDHARWESTIERSILRRYLLGRQLGRQRTATEYLRAHVAGRLDAHRQLRHTDAIRPAGSSS
jgi:GT2 family glycosyltransferase